MTTHSPEFGRVLIQLLRGIVYREDDEALWQILLKMRPAVMDYFEALGLDLVGAKRGLWISQESPEGEEGTTLPRLISRRPLSYPVSLILALFRRRFAEHDASQSDPRLIIDREDLAKQVEVFMQKGTNEVQWLSRLDTYLNRIQELGFIRYLGEDRKKIEVRRVLKVFVDAQWLAEFDRRLEEYRQFEYGKKEAIERDGSE